MTLDQLFQSGNIALLILAVMLAEALFFRHHIRNYPGILAGLGAGAALVLALRAALLQQGTGMIAMFLSLSFVFHILEIWQWLRLTRQQPR